MNGSLHRNVFEQLNGLYGFNGQLNPDAEVGFIEITEFDPRYKMEAKGKQGDKDGEEERLRSLLEEGDCTRTLSRRGLRRPWRGKRPISSGHTAIS